MRGLRNILGIALIVLGLSGIVLTVMVVGDPAAGPEAADDLEPQAPSMDTWVMGLAFSGMTVTGVWLHRTAQR
jgi:hypothetical protein